MPVVLPEEVVELICWQVRPRSAEGKEVMQANRNKLVRMSLVNRTWYRSARRALYYALVHSNIPRPLRLIRSLTENRELARLVRLINWISKDPWNMAIRPSEVAEAEEWDDTVWVAWSRAVVPRRLKAQAMAAARKVTEEGLLVTLVCVCQRLTTLYEVGPGSLMRDLQTDGRLFPNLEILLINGEQMRINGEQRVVNTVTMEALCNQPVECAELHNVVLTRHVSIPARVEQALHLRRLCLDGVVIKEEGLKAVVQCFPMLINLGVMPRMCTIHASILSQQLGMLQHLRNLIIRPKFTRGFDHGHLQLNHLSASYISVDAPLLYGYDGVINERRAAGRHDIGLIDAYVRAAPTLHDILPETLESLHLCQDLPPLKDARGARADVDLRTVMVSRDTLVKVVLDRTEYLWPLPPGWK